MKIFRYILFLFIFTLVALEIILRIYNPLGSRVKGDKILLPVNQKYVVDNMQDNGVATKVVHTKNHLGFRGSNPPQNLQEYLSIITIGGSTTECFYLSDGKDWTAQLGALLKKDFKNVWINNAGLDGHSTYGHRILLNDFIQKLHPKICIFLVGANDLGREDISSMDEAQFRSNAPWYSRLAKYSEVVNLVLNIIRSNRVHHQKLDHTYTISKIVQGDTLVTDNRLTKNKYSYSAEKKYLDNYANRLQGIINDCRHFHIDPIFVTQPSLLGNAIDSLTGFNFANTKLYDTISGLQYWETLQLYNKVTVQKANENSCFVIDIADSFPKSRKYFYDALHFTEDGAKYLADELNRKITPYLEKKYPRYYKK